MTAFIWLSTSRASDGGIAATLGIRFSEQSIGHLKACSARRRSGQLLDRDLPEVLG